MSERIGVYVCHCGTNIAGVVNVAEVSKWAGENLQTRVWSSRVTTSSCAPAWARN